MEAHGSLLEGVAWARVACEGIMPAEHEVASIGGGKLVLGDRLFVWRATKLTLWLVELSLTKHLTHNVCLLAYPFSAIGRGNRAPVASGR